MLPVGLLPNAFLVFCSEEEARVSDVEAKSAATVEHNEQMQNAD